MGGVVFQADYDDTNLAARTDALLAELFRLTTADVACRHAAVRLELSSRGTVAIPKSATLIESTDGLLIYRDHLCFFLKLGGSALAIDETGKSSAGVLADDFWEWPLVEQRRFLLQLVVLVAYRLRRFAIHANAVEHAGAGCLFVGQSGSGKSTLSLNFVRSGWNYVSDDVVFLAAEEDAVRALAANRHWSCTQKTLDSLPKSQQGGLRSVVDDEKRLLSVEAVTNAGVSDSCIPAIIVFPKIVAEPVSRLVELGRAEATATLIEYSASILVDREIAAEQLRVLGRLADQSVCFRLLHGHDAQIDLETVPRLLAHYLPSPKTDTRDSSNQMIPLTTA